MVLWELEEKIRAMICGSKLQHCDFHKASYNPDIMFCTSCCPKLQAGLMIYSEGKKDGYNLKMQDK